MAQYSLVDTTGPTLIEAAREFGTDTPPDFSSHPSKNNLVWVPYTHSGVPEYDPNTEIIDPVNEVISATEHTITYTKRALTQQELDQRDSDHKDTEIERLQNRSLRVVFEVLFDHENRIRALEGQGALTKQQALTAIRSMLDAL